MIEIIGVREPSPEEIEQDKEEEQRPSWQEWMQHVFLQGH